MSLRRNIDVIFVSFLGTTRIAQVGVITIMAALELQKTVHFCISLAIILYPHILPP